ncbi:DEAD/DEAH box helicase [Paenibacillus sp. DXFW5]|uniref:DEAD/DEAH box helicase n=1 Tax=Paenibacillus rhizolycopersici TaxID=2780073 RepID=A0ABS2H8F8_9BACL|nr:DEAD/DEAH box helicase [Paenibacillus rhizolycopersici]MBM6995768.1 DEAD/DEAH box helicase [Paenibacillus rhizolycopersici]
MKQASWKLINNDTLVIQNHDGSIYKPSSLEIFLSEFKSKFPLKNIALGRPSASLPQLKFSKVPVPLKVLAGSEISGSSTILKLELTVVRPVNEYPQIINLNDRDYIIEDNVWTPFEQGALEDISEKLKKAGITSFGRVTLKQYLSFKILAPHLIDDSSLNFRASTQQGGNEPHEIPLFKGILYPYQFQGYKWLKMISEEDAGCILADEMGLGKTAQIIAVIAAEKTRINSPSMVIAPVSLMENWRREVNKFAPDLKVYLHQGNGRTGFYQNLMNFDIVVTTYDTVVRDLSMLQMVTWNLVILDEAQAIKNPTAKRSISVKQIPRRTSIAVTGTPVENKLIDLWSLMDFSLPGFLGELREFESRFTNDIDGAQSLEEFVSPVMLRRRVREVAQDLPARIDIPQVLEMSDSEVDEYEALRQDIIKEYGKSASLISLIKLRMYCTHPILQSKVMEDPSRFIKYQRMLEITEEIIENNEKLIVFTSFTQMADIMVTDLTNRFGVFCDFIDGRVSVSERQAKIDAFSKESKSAILILNPRAAGAGLNITAANHVIHYNLEWNPAIEDQASARAYRRGQTRPVNIYRLFYANTVEEAINLRLDRKREISETAVVGNDGTADNYADILQALTMTPKHRS